MLGDPEKKTVEMLVQKINAAGGINGVPLNVVIYDDESDATKCALAVKKLMTEDKVLVVIGPSLSGLSLAVVPLAETNETPLISCAASYKIVLDEKSGKPYKWVFKTPQSDSLAVEAIFAHMKKKGISKIAILTATDGFGQSGRQELLRIAGLPGSGMEIVADEKYGPKDTDLTAQLTKIKGLSPQAIVNWSIGPVQVVALRNAKDLGIKTPFYQSHGFGNRNNIQLAAGAAEGVLVPLGACNIDEILPASHAQKATTTEYATLYKAKFNESLSSFGGHGWDGLMLAVGALKTAGPDRAKIRDALEQTKNYVGQHGIFNMSPTDHNGLTSESFSMVVVKGSDWALAD
jgi:branched-chain amino acid transport system substrate-binding protein